MHGGSSHAAVRRIVRRTKSFDACPLLRAKMQPYCKDVPPPSYVLYLNRVSFVQFVDEWWSRIAFRGWVVSICVNFVGYMVSGWNLWNLRVKQRGVPVKGMSVLSHSCVAITNPKRCRPVTYKHEF